MTKWLIIVHKPSVRTASGNTEVNLSRIDRAKEGRMRRDAQNCSVGKKS